MNAVTSKIAAVLLAIAFIGGAWLFLRPLADRGTQPVHATVLSPRMPLPDFAMIDQDGMPFTRESLRGNWNLLFFGFASCPDICPTTLQVLSAAREKLAADGRAGAALPRIILISVDPDRDSPDVLHSYVSNFGQGIIGLAGSMDELQKLTQTLGIFFAKSPAGDSYTVDHTSAVLVIDPQADFHAVFSGPHSIEKLVHDLPLVMAAERP